MSLETKFYSFIQRDKLEYKPELYEVANNPKSYFLYVLGEIKKDLKFKRKINLRGSNKMLYLE